MFCKHQWELINDDDNEKEVGDEKFIKLRVVFMRDDGYALHYPIVTPSALYACPKCGTVRAEQD